MVSELGIGIANSILFGFVHIVFWKRALHTDTDICIYIYTDGNSRAIQTLSGANVNVSHLGRKLADTERMHLLLVIVPVTVITSAYPSYAMTKSILFFYSCLVGVVLLCKSHAGSDRFLSYFITYHV